MADTEAGGNSQQAGAGSSTYTASGHRVDIGADESMAAGVASFTELAKLQALQSIQDARVLTNQMFQNSIENANLVAKRTIHGFDIANDRQWNLDEVSNLARDIPFDLQSLNALIVKAVADAVSK